jgi:hypothetical protein
MIEIDYSKYKVEPYQLIKDIANNAKIDSHKITLFYEEIEYDEILDVHHIGYVDYYYLKEAFNNITREVLEDNEAYSLELEQISPSDILSIRLHVVDAGPYISGTITVNGNYFSSNCDTYGPYYYSSYYLYQREIDSYIRIVEKNYAI